MYNENQNIIDNIFWKISFWLLNQFIKLNIFFQNTQLDSTIIVGKIKKNIILKKIIIPSLIADGVNQKNKIDNINKFIRKTHSISIYEYETFFSQLSIKFLFFIYL